MSLELVDLLSCKVLYSHSLLDKEKHGIPIILLIQIEYSQWPIPTSIFFESPGKPEVLFPRLLKKNYMTVTNMCYSIPNSTAALLYKWKINKSFDK